VDKKLGTDTVELTIQENGIVLFLARAEMKREFTLEDMEKLFNVVEKLPKNNRLFLIPIRNGKYSREARKYMGSRELIADKIAMVAEKPYQMLIGNFFLGLHKPKITIKLFRTIEKAEEWLLS
jgi:hypothetical protein